MVGSGNCMRSPDSKKWFRLSLAFVALCCSCGKDDGHNQRAYILALASDADVEQGIHLFDAMAVMDIGVDADARSTSTPTEATVSRPAPTLNTGDSHVHSTADASVASSGSTVFDAAAPVSRDAAPSSILEAGIASFITESSETGHQPMCVDCLVEASLPTSRDFDEDGLVDADDWDDDDDGIADSLDDQPLVATISPGAASAYPGALLADPCVAKALKEYEELRVVRPELREVVLHRGHDLPDLSGLYRAPFGNGRLVAGSDDPTPGFIEGVELKFTRGGEDWYHIDGVAFDTHGSGGSWQTFPHVHRGTATQFSRFTRDPGSVNITSGHLDPDLDEVDLVVINILVSVDGTYEGQVCPFDYWHVFEIDRFEYLPSAEEVLYMCTDEGNAYVPGSVWSRQTGVACSCTTSKTVSCQ